LTDFSHAARPGLRPLLKWSGGKRGEIPFLKSAYPAGIKRVIEPFSGGAAVSFDLNPDGIILNDLSKGLVAFYRSMKDATQRGEVIACIGLLDATRKKIAASVGALDEVRLVEIFKSPAAWVQTQAQDWLAGWAEPMRAVVLSDLIDQAVNKAVKRIPALEKKHDIVFSHELRGQHLETGLQSGLYTAMRRLYNQDVASAPRAWEITGWWFVRSLCYSAMFRYSKSGKFNVPYGGIGYNSRDFASSIQQLSSSAIIDFFDRAQVFELDFQALFEHHQGFGSGDFIFVDPPYDTAFSQYNPETDFAAEDQKRLAAVLKSTTAAWMLVVKNTPFILSLYQDAGLYRGVFDKTYQANFRNRHSRAAEHLVVTNYPIPYVEPGEVGIARIS
jgi:DNA adenine methylase